MRLNKYTHKVVLYISIALFISYFVLTSVPKFDTEENKIYFKSLYIISFVLLIIYSLLKMEKMKQLLFYTGLSIILVAAFSSCSSEVETTSSLQQIYEEDVDVLSSEYASLYKNLVGTIFKECKNFSIRI